MRTILPLILVLVSPVMLVAQTPPPASVADLPPAIANAINADIERLEEQGYDPDAILLCLDQKYCAPPPPTVQSVQPVIMQSIQRDIIRLAPSCTQQQIVGLLVQKYRLSRPTCRTIYSQCINSGIVRGGGYGYYRSGAGVAGASGRAAGITREQLRRVFRSYAQAKANARALERLHARAGAKAHAKAGAKTRARHKVHARAHGKAHGKAHERRHGKAHARAHGKAHAKARHRAHTHARAHGKAHAKGGHRGGRRR